MRTLRAGGLGPGPQPHKLVPSEGTHSDWYTHCQSYLPEPTSSWSFFALKPSPAPAVSKTDPPPHLGFRAPHPPSRPHPSSGVGASPTSPNQPCFLEQPGQLFPADAQLLGCPARPTWAALTVCCEPAVSLSEAPDSLPDAASFASLGILS